MENNIQTKVNKIGKAGRAVSIKAFSEFYTPEDH